MKSGKEKLKKRKSGDSRLIPNAGCLSAMKPEEKDGISNLLRTLSLRSSFASFKNRTENRTTRPFGSRKRRSFLNRHCRKRIQGRELVQMPERRFGYIQAIHQRFGVRIERHREGRDSKFCLRRMVKCSSTLPPVIKEKVTAERALDESQAQMDEASFNASSAQSYLKAQLNRKQEIRLEKTFIKYFRQVSTPDLFPDLKTNFFRKAFSNFFPVMSKT